MHAMTRREFAMLCAAAAVSGKMAAATEAPHTVALPQGGTAPALGMGSWHLAQGRHPLPEEESALKTGISLGLTLIDTAESYGRGAAEQLVGRAIAGQRDKVFIVSKIAPHHATSADRIRRACLGSLNRLGTDHLDIYLLHWRGGIRHLEPVVSSFEALRQEGHIRRWGVSNFQVADMEDLFRVKDGPACATNQVRYNLGDRRIEADLIPWCDHHGVPLMAYSPLGSGNGLLRNPDLARVAARRGVSPAAVAIAWTMRSGNTISIPESGSPEHIREDAAALNLALSQQDLADLDHAFPA